MIKKNFRLIEVFKNRKNNLKCYKKSFREIKNWCYQTRFPVKLL